MRALKWILFGIKWKVISSTKIILPNLNSTTAIFKEINPKLAIIGLQGWNREKWVWVYNPLTWAISLWTQDVSRENQRGSNYWLFKQSDTAFRLCRTDVWYTNRYLGPTATRGHPGRQGTPCEVSGTHTPRPGCGLITQIIPWKDCN